MRGVRKWIRWSAKAAALGMILLLACPISAGGEAEDAASAAASAALEELDLSGWQAVVDEAGAELDVVALAAKLARGEEEFSPEALVALLRGALLGQAQALFPRLMAVMGPALLWALSGQLLGAGRLKEMAGYICFLAGAGALLVLFAGQMNVACAAIRRLGRLMEQVFPVLMALMSSTGGAGTANLLQPLAVFGGGTLSTLLERTATVAAGSAAVLAVIGNFTARISLKSLFSLCCSAGNWLMGGVMAAFLGLGGICGVMGAARDGVTIRAAKYAVDNLLPVVGGDVADTMDAMLMGALLVRSAAGVTGMLAMLAVCLRPVLDLILTMLLCRLAAALIEPVTDGPLVTCARQMAQAVQLLLVALAVSVTLFLTLTGVVLGCASR